MPGRDADGHGGNLVRARHLSRTDWGGARVMRGCRGIRYVHVLLPEHALILADGLWVESFWPGPNGFAALDAAARGSLLRAQPALARGLLGLAPVETVYGPRVLSVVKPCDVTQVSCKDWSARLRAPGAELDSAERP